jgi:hypothetical protein
MSRNGIVATPLDLSLPIAKQINAACLTADFFPYVLFAIKKNESGNSIDGSMLQYGADPVTGLLPDGTNAGRGLFQLTSSWPPHWEDPYVSALYAIDEFLEPAEMYWSNELQGNDLVRAIAAEYNAGRRQAIAGHEAGDIDRYTTNHYAARALTTYLALLNGEVPV